ncbi:MAG: hypothetical protein ISS79_07055 [Phycisphaerae bacterium]|nr:hypothetical protein [Phycisphaerae bacterium]
MNGKTKRFKIVLLLSSLLVLGLIMLNGCNGEEAEADPNKVAAVAVVD